jgi:hypothetical protein
MFCLWYIKPLAYGILTPLSMVNQTSYSWYIEPHTHGGVQYTMDMVLDLPWIGGSKYNE